MRFKWWKSSLLTKHSILKLLLSVKHFPLRLFLFKSYTLNTLLFFSRYFENGTIYQLCLTLCSLLTRFTTPTHVHWYLLWTSCHEWCIQHIIAVSIKHYTSIVYYNVRLKFTCIIFFVIVNGPSSIYYLESNGQPLVEVPLENTG